MKRRDFIRLSSLAVLPYLTGACQWQGLWPADIPVTIHSDRKSGHAIRESLGWPTDSQSLRTDYLIIGGGIAGLSAAYTLRDRDYLLCELSDRLGGTSAATLVQGKPACQGAHYELAYPQNYGPEVLQMLQELDIIRLNDFSGLWDFKDSQYVIASMRERACFAFGERRDDVLPDGPEKAAFLQHLASYEQRVPFPTRIIAEDLRPLGEISFLEFLAPLQLSESFIRGLDYHMLDDWGGTCAQVSAIAGISYFKCRPYYQQEVPLFSPPQGNYYFVEKLAAALDPARLSLQQACRSLRETAEGWEAEIIDFRRKTVQKVTANKVIYAGQKHALRHILPEAAVTFARQEYAPWIVINLAIDPAIAEKGQWQNEMLVEDKRFLGFIDSWTQWPHDKEHRIFTAYYCLPPEARQQLVSAEEMSGPLLDDALGQLSKWFGHSVRKYVRGAHINLMGHAMPIPGPGYLFRDVNTPWVERGLQFAGVDSGRLPVFFEAADSGIVAARALMYL